MNYKNWTPNPGDKVVCRVTKGHSSRFTEGNVYIVKGVKPAINELNSEYDTILVEIDDVGNIDNGWCKCNFIPFGRLGNVLYGN